jgi:hypothetical protein
MLEDVTPPFLTIVCQSRTHRSQRWLLALIRRVPISYDLENPGLNTSSRKLAQVEQRRDEMVTLDGSRIFFSLSEANNVEAMSLPDWYFQSSSSSFGGA